MFPSESTNLFRNMKTFVEKNFRKVPTYLHFLCSMLIYSGIYYVGCLHKNRPTYIKRGISWVKSSSWNIIYQNNNKLRLTFLQRNFLFRQVKQIVSKGKQHVLACCAMLNDLSGGLQRLENWGVFEQKRWNGGMILFM